MYKKLSYKISFVISIVIVIVAIAFTIVLIRDKTKEMNEFIQEKGIAQAKIGKTVMENIFQGIIDDNIFSYSEVFDIDLVSIKLPKRITNGYKDISESDLQSIKKYHYKTGLDSFLDNVILAVEERFLEDSQVVYAILVDKQGYAPTHNIRYSKMLAGDFVHDRDNNRTKRIFQDIVARRISENTEKPYLKQIYKRDTGEIMWDISAPVFVKGKHWGAFRVGISMEKAHIAINKLKTKLMFFMALLVIIITLSIIKVITVMMKPLTVLNNNVNKLACGDFNVKQEIFSRDEIGNLSSSFNKMVEDLKTYMSNLEKTTKAKERIENELTIAHDIQQGILPKIFPAFPNIKELDIYALLRPARAVGGDLYDFFFIDKEHICFVIGDVSDKGVPASLFMAVSKTIIKTTAKEIKDPERILTIVNKELSTDNESCMFVTILFGILNIKTGEIIYANAGHNAPLLISTKDDTKFLEVANTIPIGIDENAKFENQTLKLEKNDMLFMYTDGVTEAFNTKDEMFGEDRLKTELENIQNIKIKELTNQIIEKVDVFAGSAPQSDDITIMILRYFGK